jgi:LysR family transcriptional regulator for metE and metH
MLDRQHLAIVREVSRAGSVTAAADRLNLSQSAISHAIAKLEARHKVRVWRKKGRSLELTQAGEYLLGLAERMVPEFDHAERVLADISRGRKGAMRIGMECHPCEQWLMRVTRPFLIEWPDVDIELRSAFSFDGVAALQAREIDVLVTPDPVNLPDLQFQPVFDYELRLVVGRPPRRRPAHRSRHGREAGHLYALPDSRRLPPEKPHRRREHRADAAIRRRRPRRCRAAGLAGA